MSSPSLAPDDTDPLLSVSVDVSAGSVTLAGEVDHCSAHLLTDAGTALAHGSASTWTVDAAGVTFCDGGGITALLSLRQQALRQGRTLQLVRVSPCVRRLLHLVGLAGEFPIGPLPGEVRLPAPRLVRSSPTARPGRRVGPLRV